MSSPPPFPVGPSSPQDRRDPQGAPWPGLIPLRPLLLGDVFSGAWRLLRAHWNVLVPVALLGNLISAATVLGILAGLDDTDAYFSSDWLEQVMAGTRTGVPGAVLWPAVAGLLIGLLTTTLTAGLATVFAADDSLGRPSSAATAFARLRGRWPALLGTAFAVALLVGVGFTLFFVPGLIALAVFLLATPAAALEKAAPPMALGRSAELSRGMRWRLLGVFVLAMLVAGLVSGLLSSVVPMPATMGGLTVGLLASSLIGAVTTPWIAGVVALLYIDTRIRKEGLAPVLIRAARQV